MMRAVSVPSVLSQLALRVWQLCFRPLVSIADKQESNRARNAAFVSGVQLVSFSLFYVYRLGTVPNLLLSYRLIAATILICFTLAYVLSRFGQHQIAIWLSVITISALLYVSTLIGAVVNISYVLSPLHWLLAMLLVMSWLVRPVAILVLTVVNFLVLILIALLRPDLIQYNMGPVYLQIFTIATLILAYSIFRDRDQQVIEARSRELSQSEDRYRTLFDSGFDSVVVHRDFRIIDVNTAAEALTGYSRQELLAMRTLDLLTPESLKQVPLPTQTPPTAQYEMDGIRKDGTVFPVEIRSKAILYQGQPARALSVRDMSLQRESEANRTAVLIEQQRTKLMRDFLRNASHDLRTPMAVMNTKLYLIERYLDQPEKALDQINGIKSQVSRLSQMLDDMLFLTQLDQTPLELELAPINLNEIADWLRLRYQAQAANQKITLQVDRVPDPVLVLADTAELMRALQRLVENALLYTSDAGTITLRTRRTADTGLIEIADTGIGIPPEALPHLFERFFRVDDARNSDSGGAGLGLPIAHALIEAHQGRITVQSSLGKGSTFAVQLPLAPASATETLASSL
jgi:PAS domain S-box-containing protein